MQVNNSYSTSQATNTPPQTSQGQQAAGLLTSSDFSQIITSAKSLEGVIPAKVTPGRVMLTEQQAWDLMQLPHTQLTDEQSTDLYRYEMRYPELRALHTYQQSLEHMHDMRVSDIITIGSDQITLYEGGGMGGPNKYARFFVAMDHQQTLENLRKEFGSQVQIESFPPGTGPTDAELYEMRTGRNLADVYKEQYLERLAEIAEQKKQTQDIENASMRLRLANLMSAENPVDKATPDALLVSKVYLNDPSGLAQYQVAFFNDGSVDLPETLKQLNVTGGSQATMGKLEQLFGRDMRIEYMNSDTTMTRADYSAAAATAKQLNSYTSIQQGQ